MTTVTKDHLQLAERYVGQLIQPDGIFSKEWALMQLAALAAVAQEQERQRALFERHGPRAVPTEGRQVWVLEDGEGKPIQSAIHQKRVFARPGTSQRVERYVPEHFERDARDLMKLVIDLQGDLAAKVLELEEKLAASIPRTASAIGEALRADPMLLGAVGISIMVSHGVEPADPWTKFDPEKAETYPEFGAIVQFVTHNGTTVGMRRPDAKWEDMLDVGADGTPNHEYTDEHVTHHAPLLEAPEMPE